MNTREALDIMRSALRATQRPASIIAELFTECVLDMVRDEAGRRKVGLQINLAIDRAHNSGSPDLQTLLAIKQRFTERRLQ